MGTGGDRPRRATAAIARGYAELSPDGPDHFAFVHAKLVRSSWEEPTLTVAEVGSVTSRTLVMLADDDEVDLEHGVAVYRGLPDAELSVVPGTSHGLLSREA